MKQAMIVFGLIHKVLLGLEIAAQNLESEDSLL